jgi:HTH-type transcriptional regulator/antitoxin MqsA
MTMHANVCPVCGEGHLTERQALEAVEYKGTSGEILMTFSECDFCGSDQASALQTKLNKRAFSAYKKRVDGLLIGKEIARLRAEMNITQADAARIFGGGPVAFSKYENDDVMQSESMDTLIRLAASVPEARAWLFQRQHKLLPSTAIIPILSKISSSETTLHFKDIFIGSRELVHITALSPEWGNPVALPIIPVVGLTRTEHFITLNDAITHVFDKPTLKTTKKRSRVYGKEENSRHDLSNHYSETAV